MTDYPPLAPTSTTPLHGWGDYGPFACQTPEDPNNEYMDWRCPKCIICAQVYLVNFGDKEVYWTQDLDVEGQRVKLSWLIERSIALLGLE